MNLNQIDIEQLVAFEGFEYKLSNGRRGLQLNVKTCPACHRDDYKVYFNAHTGLGNCFGCSENFNQFSFVKYARNLDHPSKVFRYFEGIMPSVKVTPRPKVYRDIKVNKDWVLPLNRKIELDSDVPDYLLDRGIDSKIAKRFDLRFCEAGFYKYTDFNDRVKHVDFSNRIIIPVYDINGNPATFQGRDTTGTSDKKYLFPNLLPGTARYIYNANYIIKNKIKKVVLNEGVFDVFATTQALESDVAYMQWGSAGTFGKHFSITESVYEAEDQLADLHEMREQGVEEFCIMWDGERKARLAALEAGLKLRSYGFPVTVALTLPDGKDPAETGSKGILEALDKRIMPSQLALVKFRMKN